MNITDQVKRDCLSRNFITKQLQIEFDKAKKANLVNIENDILMRELDKLEDDALLDEAIQKKYNRVSEFIHISGLTEEEVIQSTNHDRMMAIQAKKRLLSDKVINHVKTVLEVLDVTWQIIQEFKYTSEMDRNMQLDTYYTSLVDTLLLKIKILHITALITTYQNEEFIEALRTLRGLLEKRCTEAQTGLRYTVEALKEYKEVGPELMTLFKAHQELTHKIQATKDDISRIS